MIWDCLGFALPRSVIGPELPPPSQPIRFKARTSYDLCFPAFLFEFSLGFFFKFPLIPPDWVLRLLWFGFYVTRSCVLKRNTDQVNKKCDSLNFGKFLCLSHGLYYISHYIPERFYFIGDRLEPLFAPIRFKLASALTNWHPSDPSAKMMLEPWSKVQTSLADS